MTIALAVALAGQVPGVLLCAAAGRPLLGPAALPSSLAFAVLLTLPLLVRLRLGITGRSEHGWLGASQVLFFGWWGASMVGALVTPPAWGVAYWAGWPSWLAAAAALAVGVASGVSGVTVERTIPRLRRIEVRVAGLPAALDGYRIAQLSDLHMGGHTPPERVRRWVDRVNALEADLVTVTGDLITSGDDYLDHVGRELGRLRGRDGVAACMGNHDYFGDHERLIARLAGEGVDVLRNRGRVVARGEARYWLAGVDDTWSRLEDVGKAMAGRPDGLTSIVLAHDPKLFDECADHGATLVLSGHTHGGQVAVPFFGRTLSLARIAYRYTAGLYRRGGSHLYVNRGAGTTGPPIRIGAPSEIALLTLRRESFEF